jgi:hypothetical protein
MRSNRKKYGTHHAISRFPGVRADDLFESLRAEVLTLTVDSFRNSVGIKHNEISWTAGQRVLFIFRIFEKSERQPGSFYRRRFPVAYPNGIGQPRIGGCGTGVLARSRWHR